MRQHLWRLLPRTLVRAQVATQTASTVLRSQSGPTTPHGVAAVDQLVAQARDALDARGIDLDSPSDLAIALVPLATVIRLADDATPEELNVALFAVLSALSSAFDDAVGGVPR